MNLDQVIDEVIKEEDQMIQSQQQNGYCVAGLLAEKIQGKTQGILSKPELLYIIHEKFKEVVRPNTSFTFTRDELEQFLGKDRPITEPHNILNTDIYQHLLKGYKNSEYSCQVCRNPHSG